MYPTTQTLRLCAEGPFALFSSPAFKVEKMTYDVMTAPAAQGLVKAVLWKPAVEVEILRIDVCAPIRHHTMTINGVAFKTRMPSQAHLDGLQDPDTLVLDVLSQRLQTRHTFLCDVKYVVHFRYRMTDKAGPQENPAKFAGMFEKRLSKGKYYRLPHFGLQQLVAHCRPVELDDIPIRESRDLGMMPHVRCYGEETVETHWFRARMDNGSIEVPPHGDLLERGVA